MRSYTQTINGTQRFNLPGSFFRLLSTVNTVSVRLYRNNAEVSAADNVESGFWIKDESGFDAVEIITGASEPVGFLVGRANAGFDRVVSTINILTLQGGTITDEAPVTVGIAATLAAAATAGTKSLRFLNNGTADIYLGSSAVTTANGAVKIPPGGIYIETEAAVAAWYAISGAAGQNLRVQRVS